MSICGTCGRPITWFDVQGKRVAFDLFQVMRGDGRFVQQEDGGLTPVRSEADVMAMQRHSETCGKGHVV